MSRRRKRPTTAPVAPPARVARGLLSTFFAENVRMMLLFAGFTALAQAFLPWTNSLDDRVPFIVAGSVMLGLAVPRRFWTR